MLMWNMMQKQRKFLLNFIKQAKDQDNLILILYKNNS